MIWTDEKVATLKAEWLKGVTSPEIAALVGATAEAVRAKRQHLGLPSRSGEVAVEAFKVSGRQRRTAKTPPPKAHPNLSLLGPLPGSTPRPWLSRGFGECAFPVGGAGAETLSCCLRTVTGGYCGGHIQIMRGGAR